MYSVLCAVGVVFVILCVPETKGRDLESIHKLFEKEQPPTKVDNVETGSKQGQDNVAMVTGDEIRSCAEVSKFDTRM